MFDGKRREFITLVGAAETSWGPCAREGGVEGGGVRI